MSNKNEEAPTNSTGPAVAGTGDTADAWKKKKKKKKVIKRYDCANEDNEPTASVDTPVITPDLTFATMPVFKVGADDFAKCKFGKSKFARWAKHIDVTSDSGKRIYAYAKKNPHKSIIVQHEKSGHMLYLRKYSKSDGGKSGIMVKKREKTK